GADEGSFATVNLDPVDGLAAVVLADVVDDDRRAGSGQNDGDAAADAEAAAGDEGNFACWVHHMLLRLVLDELAVVSVGVEEGGDDAAPVLLAFFADELDAFRL